PRVDVLAVALLDRHGAHRRGAGAGVAARARVPGAHALAARLEGGAVALGGPGGAAARAERGAELGLALGDDPRRVRRVGRDPAAVGVDRAARAAADGPDRDDARAHRLLDQRRGGAGGLRPLRHLPAGADLRPDAPRAAGAARLAGGL